MWNTRQSLQIKIQQQLRKRKLQQQTNQPTKFKQIKKPILPNEISPGDPNIFCL